MNKLIGIAITVLLVLSLIPVAITMTDNYNVENVAQSFTAVQDVATPEVVTVDNTPVEVIRVTVEGVELVLTTEYTVSGDEITISADKSVADDIIVVYYSYEMTTTSAQDALVDLIPTLVIIALVVGVALTLKMRN